MKISPQSPARITWEEAVLTAIEASGITRSDAQSMVEVDEELLESLYLAGTEPAAAARRFID